MRLPFRIKVADDTEFEVPVNGGLRVLVTIREYEVPKTEEEEHGSGIDDGRGTFLQSTVSVLFPNESLDEISTHWSDGGTNYVNYSVEAINSLIQAYRYISRHAFARPVERPREVDVVVVDEMDEIIPNVPLVWRMQFIGGISLKPTLQADALKLIQRTIDGDSPLGFERLLLLDAEFFAELGDVSHAVFNIDTALQVFIDRVLSDVDDPPSFYYSKWDDGLKSACGHTLHEAEFIDSRPFGTDDNVNAFEIIECIHVVRNSIAHEGRPIFRVEGLGKWESRFIERHRKWDDTEVPAPQARIWVGLAGDIMRWVEDRLR